MFYLSFKMSSITISYGGRMFILNNLNEDQTNELCNDSNKLMEHFNQCMSTGANISVLEAAESLTPMISNISPTDSIPEGPDDIILTAATSKKAKKKYKISEDEQILYDEILASQVMVQPMLHNPKLKSHKFSGATAEKWKQIGERISKDCPNADTSISKVKERWIKIRDDYLKRQRLKKRVTGSGRTDSDDEDGEPFDELLSGLKDVYDTKETASNIKHNEETSEEYRGTDPKASPKDRKMNCRQFEDGALQILESNSEKFLSAIENFKDSFFSNKENTINVNTNQDKVTKFCDMLQLQLRELDDNQFLEAQIEILQVLHKVKH